MKSTLLAATAAAIISMLFATLANAKTITIDGQQSNYRFEETSAVYRTEYRTETRQETCSRQVVDGYEEECRWVRGGRSCHSVGGGQTCRTVDGGQSCGLTPSGQQCFDLPDRQVCDNEPPTQVCEDEPDRHVCSSVPRYRTEYYTCTKQVQVPYQVKEYDVVHDVVINVERNQRLTRPAAEVVDFAVNGAELNLRSVKSSGRYLLAATKSTSEVSNNGALRRFQSVVDVKLVDKAAALSIYQVPASELTGDLSGLQLSVGPISDARLIRVDLIVKQDKLFKDKTVIEKTLTEADYSFTNEAGKAVIRIDIARLGADQLSGKKAKIEVKVQTVFDLNSVINREDVPSDLVISKRLEKRL